MKNYMITNAMMQMCAGIIKQGCEERANCHGCTFKNDDTMCNLSKGLPDAWKGVLNQEVTFPVLNKPDVLQLPALIGNTVIYKSVGETHIMVCGDKKTAEEKWKELSI